MSVAQIPGPAHELPAAGSVVGQARPVHALVPGAAGVLPKVTTVEAQLPGMGSRWIKFDRLLGQDE